MNENEPTFTIQPQPFDSAKYHTLKPLQNKNILLIVLLLVFVIIPAFSFGYYKLAVRRPSPLDKELMFEIKTGEGVAIIAQNLQNANAVNSKFLFMVYVYLNRMDRGIQAGVYTLRAGEDVVSLAEKFQHGVNDVKITFLEGWRIEEFARRAAKNLSKIDYNKFISLAAGKEGYLAPDTYQFNKDITEEEVLKILSDTFKSNTDDLLTPQNLAKAKLTKEQAVIFASIVEREVNTTEDRPVVAGILIKRFKEGMRIEADATTQYAVAAKRLCAETPNLLNCTPTFENILKFEWWEGVTQDDLTSDSPYNTRKVVGLPPTPICSFNSAALKAVLDYKETPYYFYLTDPTGVTHYAKTLDEHNANVAKYLN